MKVLVIASTYPAHPGDGTPGFVRDIAVALTARMEVSALVPSMPGAPTREIDDGVSLTRFRYFPRPWENLADGAILENLRASRVAWIQLPCYLVSETWHLWRAVRRERPDVLFINWLIPQGMVALLAARKVPWVVQTLGGDLYALNDPIFTRIKRAIAGRARAVCAMNDDMRQRLLALGSDPDSTHVLAMGADVIAMGAAAQATPAVRGRIATVGRLVEKKGFHVLLDAVAKLPGDWTLDIVGDGPMRQRLERQAGSMPVRFLGQQSRETVARTLAAAEVLVYPSVASKNRDQDGLPLALLEGMATGRAIVVSDLPGLSEAIRHGIDGIVVPAGDSEALAGAIRRLVVDGSLRKRLGVSAAARSARYGIAATVDRYAALLEEAAGAARAGSSSG